MSDAGAVTAVRGSGGALPACIQGGLPGGLSLPSMGDLRRLSARPDILLAVAVMGILVVLVVPLPAILLDLLLAISIIVSVLILMTALFIENPMEFSVFPTVLLIATMFRLALNLATTRLILAHGHESGAPAGHVIEAFGHFEEAARAGEMPVLVTSSGARPFVRSIIERFRRENPVIGQAEIHARVRLKTVGSV